MVPNCDAVSCRNAGEKHACLLTMYRSRFRMAVRLHLQSIRGARCLPFCSRRLEILRFRDAQGF